LLKSFIKSRFVTFALIIVASYLVYLNLRILYFNINYSLKIKATNRLIITEEERNKDLAEQLKDTNSVQNIEQKARIILGLIKKDETAYKIIDKKGD